MTIQSVALSVGIFSIRTATSSAVARQVLTATLVLGLVVPCLGQTSVWQGPDTAQWHDAGNWDNAIPSFDSAVASFGVLGPSIFGNVTVDAPVSISSLTLQGGVPLLLQGNEAIVFSGQADVAMAVQDPGSLLIVNNELSSSHAGPIRVDVGAEASLQLGGVLSLGSNPLIKQGEGSTQFSGDNSSWSGQLLVDSGSITISNAASFGSGAATIEHGTVVAAGAHLSFGSPMNVRNEYIRLNGGAIRSSGNDVELLGPLEIATDSIVNSESGAPSAFDVGGPMSGSGTLRISDSQVNLGGNNTGFTGQLLVESGRLIVDSSNGLGTNDGIADGTVLQSGTTMILTNSGKLNGESIQMSDASIEVLQESSPLLAADLTLIGQNRITSPTDRQFKTLGQWTGPGGVTYSGIQNGVLQHSGDYVGRTIIDEGRMTVVTSTAFGSPDAATEITNAIVLLTDFENSDEPFVLGPGSELRLDVGQQSGPITLTGGTVNVESNRRQEFALTGPLTIDGSGAIGDGNRGVVKIMGGVGGAGLLTVTAREPVQIHSEIGDDIQLLLDRQVELHHPQTFAQRVEVVGHLLAVADVSFENLELSDYSRLTSAENGRITVSSLDIGGAAEIDADLMVGDGPFNVDHSGRVKFTRLGEAFFNEILVSRGALYVTGNQGLGNAQGRTVIDPDGTGQILIGPNVELADDIDLNNARGIADSGGLIAHADRRDSGIARLTGTIDLGAIGAVIGRISPGYVELELAGPIVGGDLKHSGGFTKIFSDQALYSGKTEIAGGKILLSGEGRLRNTSEIILGHQFSELVLDNVSNQNSDRIPDSAPVVFRGGTLAIDVTHDAPTTERFGAIKVEQGHSRIEDRSGGSGRFVVDSLERTPGATIDIGPSSADRMHITNPPESKHGMIAGWARTSTNVFAALNGTEVVQITETRKRISEGNPGEHIWWRDIDTLTSDRTIASLTSIGRAEVDFGGHRLTIESGGLIGTEGHFSNGELTSGEDELFLYGGTYDVSIVDVDGPVSVVVGERAYLGGVNTYTGKTTINTGGQLFMTTPDALPDDADVDVHGGELRIAGPAVLGTVNIRGGGILSVNDQTGDTYTVRELNVESGGIAAGLEGTARILKTTPGVLTLHGNFPGYSGVIEVEEGVLIGSAGSGEIRLSKNALLVPGDNTQNRVVSNGGSIWGGGLLGDLSVRADSKLVAKDFGELTSGRSADLRITGVISGPGNLEVDSDFGAVFLEGANPDYRGQIDVVGGELVLEHFDAIGPNSRVVIHKNGNLKIFDSTRYRGNIEFRGGNVEARLRPDEVATLLGEVDVVGHTTGRFARLAFAGSLDLNRDSSFTISAASDLHVSGELHVGQRTSLRTIADPDSDPSSARITGIVIAGEMGASLDLVGTPALLTLAAHEIQVPSGTELALLRNGEQFPLRIGADAIRLTGGGSLNQDIELLNDGTIAPGEEVVETLSIGGGLIAIGGRIELGVSNFDDPNAIDKILVTGDASFPSPAELPTFVLSGSEELSGAAFDPRANYSWTVVSAANLIVGDDSRIPVDASNIERQIPLSRHGRFALLQQDNSLVMDFTGNSNLGDFDQDGGLSIKDIDSLLEAIREASDNSEFDLNLDGVVDTNDSNVLVERLANTYFGDANLDGEFNSADFVAVFQAGQYEDQFAGNSTWATGDWSGDGEFTSSDFIIAFQSGGYEAGPRIRIAAVPESLPSPTAIVLCLILACRKMAAHRKRSTGSKIIRFRHADVLTRYAVCLAAIALLLVPGASPGLCQTASTWSGGNGRWFDSSNWIGAAPNSGNSSAILGTNGSPEPTLIEVDQPVDLSVLVSAGTISTELSGDSVLLFNHPEKTPSIIVATGSGPLRLGVPVSVSTDQTLAIDVAENAVVNFKRAMAAHAGSISFGGGGHLDLSVGNSAWTGTLDVNDGRVNVFDSGALGGGDPSVTNQTIVRANGDLRLHVDLQNERISLAGGRLSTVGRIDVASPIELLTDSLASNRTLNTTTTLSGPISGPGGLRIDRSAFRLTGENSFGGELIVDGAMVTIAHPQALGEPDAGTTVLSGTLRLDQPTNEPIELVGGTVDVRAMANGGITAHDGTISYRAEAGTNNVELLGATLSVQEDLDVATILHPGSTTGDILINRVNFTAGGSNRVSLADLPGGGLQFRLGTNRTRQDILPEKISEILPATDQRLRVGAGIGNLNLLQMIGDGPTGSTSIEQSGRGRTTLNVENTYSGQTEIRRGTVVLDHARGLGTDSGGVNDATSVFADGELLIDAAANWSNELVRLDGGTIDFSDRVPTRAISSPIEVVSDGEINGDGVVSYNGQLSGNGNLAFDHSDFSIAGENSFGGVIELTGGRLNATAPGTLGSPTFGSTVNGGRLLLDGPKQEPIAVQGGLATIADGSADYSAPITLSGGLLELQTEQPFTGPIKINADTAQVEMRNGQLFGGSTGDGELSLSFRELLVGGAPLAHNGDLRLRGDTARLMTPNRFTGTTHVDGAEVFVENPMALGTVDNPTVIGNRGTVRLSQASDERFILDPSGTLDLSSGPGEARVEMRGGRVQLDGAEFRGHMFVPKLTGGQDTRLGHGTWSGQVEGEGDISIGDDQATVVSGDNSYLGITRIVRGDVQVDHSNAFGSTTGPTIVERGVLKINVPLEEPIILTRAGTVDIASDGVRAPHIPPMADYTKLRISEPISVDRPIDLFRGEFHIDAAATVTDIRLHHGTTALRSQNGRTLTIETPEFNLHTGIVDVDIAGPEAIVKRGMTTAEIHSTRRFPGEIRVARGELRIRSRNALGATEGATRVGSNRAALVIVDGGSYRDPIFLENANGFRVNDGGLVVDSPFGTDDNRILGPLDLGNIGSTVGVRSGSRLSLEGPITGGSLTIDTPDDYTSVLSDQNSYTGATNLRRGVLWLWDTGTLGTTSNVRFSQHGTLLWDIKPGTELDRIPDAAPIEFNGGNISVTVDRTQAFNEVVGPVTFRAGHASFGDLGFSIANESRIEFESMQREPGSSLNKRAEHFEVHFRQAPTLSNGILGGWALADEGFATYGPNGIQQVDAVVGNINTAASTDNVVLNSGSRLSTDTTINSLVTSVDPLRLDGHRLTVLSGGVFGNVEGGEITAGNGEDAELFLHGGNISADIVDNHEGSISTVITNTRGVSLSGSNSYTGPTLINSTYTQLNSPNSLPSGGDVFMRAGTLVLKGNSHTVGTIEMRDNARIQGDGELQFEQIGLHSGEIEKGLTGTGTIVKTSGGLASIRSIGPDFAGSVEVRDGALEVSSIGTASVLVDGGWFQPASISNAITVKSGVLAVLSSTLSGPLTVDGDATIATLMGRISDLRGAGRLSVEGYGGNEFSAAGTPLTFDNLVQFDGVVDISWGGVQLETNNISTDTRFSVANRGFLNFVLPSTNATVELDGGRLFFDERVSAVSGSLTVSGASRLDRDQDATVTVNSALTFSDGAEFQTAGWQLMTVSGPIHVNGRASIHNAFGDVLVNGTVTAGAANSVLDLAGPAGEAVQMGAGLSLSIPGDTSLTVLQKGVAERIVISDPMSTVSGSGTIRNPMMLGRGATLSPGDDGGIGTLTVGDLTFASGAIWRIGLASAFGESGDAWDSLVVNGVLGNSATANQSVVVSVGSQDGNGNATALQGFDASQPYRWLVASSRDLLVDVSSFRIDAERFRQQNAGADDAFALMADGTDLWLTYRLENVLGDFNGNGIVDASDIDLLSREVREGEPSLRFDLNQDGTVNELDRVTWVEEIANTFFGDANLDGEFNSSDFVLVFQRSQYEDGVASNSGWVDGDWDGNQEFETSDFVRAFQSDGYEKGPRVAAVPEASCGLLLLGLLPIFLSQCRSVARHHRTFENN